MWYVLIGCSAALAAALAAMAVGRCRRDPGLNARIVVTWGENVNEAKGGRTDILDEELGDTLYKDVPAWEVSLESLSTGEIARGKFLRELVVGREPRGTDGCMTLNVSGISRIHCRIFSQGGEIYLEDLGSSNHTYLNGERVSVPMLLKSGDIIHMGREEYRYRGI